MATFDNSYKKCYNKRSDNNKKAICHQTGKNAPGKRFRVYPYKIPMSGQKRRTAHLHKNWEYKKPEIVRRGRTAYYYI